MIICITGPTGVGKTKLSIELAKIYNAIILNADAMQIYKGLDIGTAKIKESEKEGIPHYLFDIADVKTNYTVYNYQKDARKILSKYQDKNIIFVGGSGLYLKAALYNYVFSEENTPTNNYDNLTNEELYALALKKDPHMPIHANNRQRLIRFLNKKDISNEPCYLLYPAIFIGLTAPRDILYNRINARVDEMFNEGLVLEAKSFYDLNIKSKALETAIGYKELFRYFNNEISLEEAKDLIKKNSRHYAKRQYTWFNHQMPVKWFNVDFNNFNNTLDEVKKYLEQQDS